MGDSQGSNTLWDYMEVMLLKVLHKPPRPLRIYMPKLEKGKGLINKHVVKVIHKESYKHSESL